MKYLFFLLTLFLSISSFCQSFEGKVTYTNTYKSKMPAVTDEQLTAMMGTTQEYYIKGGDYKSVFNGTFMQWQLYINKDNKMYNKMSNSAALLWNDGATNTDEVLEATVNKTATEILGYKCDELVLTCKSGVQKYYFNASLAIDSKLYALHLFGNWHEFLSRTNALPLKSIVDNSQFYLESVATEVKTQQLNAQFFALPADAKIMKSPY